ALGSRGCPCLGEPILLTLSCPFFTITVSLQLGAPHPHTGRLDGHRDRLGNDGKAGPEDEDPAFPRCAAAFPGAEDAHHHALTGAGWCRRVYPRPVISP